MRWSDLFEDSAPARRLRQRAAALAAAFVFLSGLTVAIGLGSFLLLLCGTVGIAGLIAATVWAFLRHRPWAYVRRPRLDGAVPRAASLSLERWAKVCASYLRFLAAQFARGSRRTLTAAQERVRDLLATLSDRSNSRVRNRSVEWRGWPYAGSAEAAATPVAQVEPVSDEPRRRALELNARGAQLRRAGEIAPAIDQHVEAVEIFRRLGDRRAQAPTLNSLALALVAAGETEAAVERFEESLEILRGLEDEGGEGRVIANLGFTLLQQGADERARELLAIALEKLPPESPGAHQVEAQLRRAS